MLFPPLLLSLLLFLCSPSSAGYPQRHDVGTKKTTINHCHQPDPSIHPLAGHNCMHCLDDQREEEEEAPSVNIHPHYHVKMSS